MLSIFMRLIVSLVLLVAGGVAFIFAWGSIEKAHGTEFIFAFSVSTLFLVASVYGLFRVWRSGEPGPSPRNLVRPVPPPSRPIVQDSKLFDDQGFDRWLSANGF